MHPLTRITNVPVAIRACSHADCAWRSTSLVMTIHPRFRTTSVVCQYGHYVEPSDYNHDLKKWVDAQFAFWQKHSERFISTRRNERRLKIGAFKA